MHNQETENEMNQLRDQIAAALAAKKQTAEDLYAGLKDAENKKQVVNALYTMREAGLVDRDNDGRYSLTGVSGNIYECRVQMGRLSPAKKRKVRVAIDSLPKISRPPPMPATAAPHAGGEALRRVMETSVVQTQNALDDYLASLADSAVLTPLRTARDAARAALTALDAKGT